MSGIDTGLLTRARAARLHYLRGLSKSEIAEQLGVSRFAVARMLERARSEGLVRVEVREPVALDDDRADALERAFGLRQAIVVRDGEEVLARAAAGWLLELLGRQDLLGVAWGTTLEATLRALPPASAPRARAVVQLAGQVAGVTPGASAAELTWRFAERLACRAVPLPAPAFAGDAEERDALVANPAVAPATDLFGRVDTALVGIGSLAPGGRSALLRSCVLPAGAAAALRRRGGVADLVVHVLDGRGRPVAPDLAERAVAISMQELRRARVIAVAGAPGKGAAVAAALASGVVDVLVTDAPTADGALAERP
jgi:DNA-binding transcriptional regulator LsrR (DeoR family)